MSSHLDRRAFLRTAGAASTAALLAGCMRKSPSLASQAFAPISFPNNACNLPPVDVSADREIRTVVGLRPFRPSGFVVRAEKFDDHLVVHNYGHGGAGITLSWGTAKLALDLGAPGYTGDVAVLGSGAVGLATARLAQEHGFHVTIYTKDLPPNTTSNIAGGQWFPVSVSEPDRRTPAFNAQFLAAAQYAYARYQTMLGPRFAVRWMPNYFFFNEPLEPNHYLGANSVLRPMMPQYRELAPNEYPFPRYPHALQFDTMLIEPPIYLAAMLDEFEIAGGKIIVREIPDPSAITALPEKLIFNCTGLGARALFNDTELVPLKGQLTFLLPQPEVQYAALPPDWLYMFPRTDGILLGGTHEMNNWSLDVNEQAKQKILAGHKAFFDAFRSCRAT
jgi:D-amino-acid oxidase